jgi:hypothetical protein
MILPNKDQDIFLVSDTDEILELKICMTEEGDLIGFDMTFGINVFKK